METGEDELSRKSAKKQLILSGRDARRRVCGGAGGIRTLDTLLTYTHFPGERLRPLGHRSACTGRSAPSGTGALSQGREGWHKRFMHKPLLAPVLPVLAALAPSLAAAAPPVALASEPKPLAPPEIVGQAPVADWSAIAPADLLVMDLAPDAAGKPRRVVIQLLPAPFSQGWIGNIRTLAAAHWWNGTSVNRVQDNYVVQWGDADGEDAAKAKPLPQGLKVVPQSDYETDADDAEATASTSSLSLDGQGAQSESYSFTTHLANNWNFGSYGTDANWDGWPMGLSDTGKGRKRIRRMWPVHCYGTVGVGRNMPPDTGTGAELYAVIGHAPHQLDRNIAVVGRVIEGIEHLSSLPRGTGDLGFYKTAAERTPIRAIRLGTDVPDLPRYQYLSTESASFARYADARANRRDPFYIRPAGGADICNIPVPVRRAP